MIAAVVFWVLLLLTGCGKDDPSIVMQSSNEGQQTSITEEHSGVDSNDSLEEELQKAIAAKEAKQLWAEDFFTETREEASIWRYTSLNCTEIYSELLNLLFPEASVTGKRNTPEGNVSVDLKQDSTRIHCSIEPLGVNLGGLPSKQAKELYPKIIDWIAEKTGLDYCKWQGYDPTYTPAAEVYVGCVDGSPIVAKAYSLTKYYGLWRDQDGFSIIFPVLIGEKTGTVKLFDQFSPEELQMTLEFNFDPNEPVIEVYRSCELCYLIHEQKGLLIPVWCVKGTRYNFESDKDSAIEYVFDAETGSVYDFGGA